MTAEPEEMVAAKLLSPCLVRPWRLAKLASATWPRTWEPLVNAPVMVPSEPMVKPVKVPLVLPFWLMELVALAPETCVIRPWLEALVRFQLMARLLPIRKRCDAYGDGSGAGEVAAVIEGKGAGCDGGAGADPAFDVAAGQGRVVAPTGTGSSEAGVGEIDVDDVRGAQRIVHRDAGVVGVSDIGIGAEVGLNREVGGGSGRTGHADWQLNRSEPAVGVYHAVGGGIAHDLVAVGGDQIAVGVLGEIAGCACSRCCCRSAPRRIRCR